MNGKVEVRNVTPIAYDQIWAELYAYGEKICDIIAVSLDEAQKGEEYIMVHYFVRLPGKEWKILSDLLFDKICEMYSLDPDSFQDALDYLANVLSPDDKLVDRMDRKEVVEDGSC